MVDTETVVALMTGKADICTARVLASDGTLAATIARVDIGGGTQLVTVDGVAETRTHPSWTVWHVRLISPTRMMPDELREEQDYDAAVKLAEAYAAKLDEHAERIAELADDLKV